MYFYPYIYAKATNNPLRVEKINVNFSVTWPVAFIGKYLPVFLCFIAGKSKVLQVACYTWFHLWMLSVTNKYIQNISVDFRYDQTLFQLQTESMVWNMSGFYIQCISDNITFPELKLFVILQIICEMSFWNGITRVISNSFLFLIEKKTLMELKLKK